MIILPSPQVCWLLNLEGFPSFEHEMHNLFEQQVFLVFAWIGLHLTKSNNLNP